MFRGCLVPARTSTRQLRLIRQNLMATSEITETPTIQHRGEESSNDFRRRLAAIEPVCLRTFTPSLAVIERSAGCYHWTPEGRMLADFSSGVLVANLGHNPHGWWNRVL